MGYIIIIDKVDKPSFVPLALVNSIFHDKAVSNLSHVTCTSPP